MFDFVTSGEITNSLKENFKKRLTTPIYGVFLVSWLIFHWRFVFTMFFVSEEKIWRVTGLLKNDYLKQEFFDYCDWSFYVWWILPFLATYFIVWRFPKWIGIPAFEKEEEYNIAKRRIKLQKEKELEELEVKKLEVIETKAEKEKEIAGADPSIWEREYIQFRKSDFFGNFKRIIESVYKHRGFVENETVGFRIPRNVLAYAHANNLVEFSNNSNEQIKLTEKGKYFVKQYSLHNKQEDLQK